MRNRHEVLSLPLQQLLPLPLPLPLPLCSTAASAPELEPTAGPHTHQVTPKAQGGVHPEPARGVAVPQVLPLARPRNCEPLQQASVSVCACACVAVRVRERVSVWCVSYTVYVRCVCARARD